MALNKQSLFQALNEALHSFSQRMSRWLRESRDLLGISTSAQFLFLSILEILMNAKTQNSPVVLITGALTGIARATAIAFAKSGAKVVISGRHDKEGAALEAELRATGAEAKFVRADVRHDEEVRGLVDAAVKNFGRLDIAVNAAGTEGKPGPAVDQTAESYAATFDTNVLGTILSMKHELRVMLEQKSGSIVNISSTFGHEGGAGASIYSASKHAVEGLTKSVALEVGANGIRVNAVAPGPIQTGMLDRFTGGEQGKAYLATLNAQKRIGQPDEIAQAILYIASNAATFVTGHVLTVDGGKSAG
jgi:NAD(P)-dependent dehydrogenase (short-subunit alcohol dehydrogenase family)